MSRNNLDDENELHFGHDEPEPEDVSEDDEGDEENSSSEESNIEAVEDDIPKSLPEESMEDEPEEGQPKQNKKRNRAQERINQIQRDKYQALSALEQARLENEQLRQMNAASAQAAELSSQAAMRQYDDNVIKRLERAREMQIAAIESGDAQAQVDANFELASATNQMHEINNWKYKNEYDRRQLQQIQQPVYPSAPVYNPNDVLLEDWVYKNEWYNPSSEKYDSDLAQYISNEANKLDYQLANNGYSNIIKSELYFNEIDKAAQEYVRNRNNQSGQRRDLNMKPVRGGASPVRNRSGSFGNSQRREILDPDERDMARRMGVSDKAYLQSRLHDEAVNGHKRRGGY